MSDVTQIVFQIESGDPTAAERDDFLIVPKTTMDRCHEARQFCSSLRVGGLGHAGGCSMTTIVFRNVMPWLLIAFGAWLAYRCVRQNGRILLRLWLKPLQIAAQGT